MCLDNIDKRAERFFKRDKKGRVVALQVVKQYRTGRLGPVFRRLDSRFCLGRRYPCGGGTTSTYTLRNYQAGFHARAPGHYLSRNRTANMATFRRARRVVVEVRLSGELTFGYDGGLPTCVGEFRTIHHVIRADNQWLINGEERKK